MISLDDIRSKIPIYRARRLDTLDKEIGDDLWSEGILFWDRDRLDCRDEVDITTDDDECDDVALHTLEVSFDSGKTFIPLRDIEDIMVVPKKSKENSMTLTSDITEIKAFDSNEEAKL